MLTEKQRELLDFLREKQEQGECPSYDEMVEQCGLKAKSGVHRILDALEERGFIRRIKYRARAIEVLDPIQREMKLELTMASDFLLRQEVLRRGYRMVRI